MIAIKLDDALLQSYLRTLDRKMSNMSPFLDGVGEIIISSVQKNFEVGGSPRWVALKQATLKAKARKGQGSQILIGEGRLSQIGKNVTARKLQVGPTNPKAIKYAAAHQFGYTKGGIPARPYLVVSERDRKDIERLAQTYIEGGL